MAKKKLASSIPRNGLVFEALLDGNALDTNDGTKNNGTATNVTYVSTDKGYQKQASSYNGTTSKITANLSQLTNFHINFLYKPNSTAVVGTAQVGLNTYTGTSDNVGFIHSHPDSNFYKSFYVANTSGTYFPCQLVTTPQAGIWYNIGLEVSGTTMKIYLNGKLENTVSFTGTIRTNTLLSIGCGNGTVQFFNGTIQGVRVYNRVISQQEIQNLYQEGLRQLGAGSDNIMSNAIAYYDFNGDANDVIGGFNGTVTGATLTTDRFGIANRAYSFDGVDDELVNTTLNITGNKTLAFWIKSPENSSTTNIKQPVKINNTSGESDDVLAFSYNHTNSSFQQAFDIKNTASTFFSAKLTTPLLANTNYFIVGTYDGSNLRAYLNGNLEATTAISGTMFVGNRLFVGKGGAPSFFNGILELPIIFPKALSSDEVKELYNLSKIKYLYPFKKQLPLNLKDGLALHLAGDNNGTTWYSNTGSNNGTGTAITMSRVGQHKVMGFNGISSNINLGTGNIGIGGSFTFSCWYIPTSNTTASTYQILFNDWAAGANNIYIYTSITNNGILTCLSGNGVSTPDGTSLTYALTNGKKYFITYVRNGTTKTLYINGTVVATFTGGGTGGVTTNSKRIGGDISGALNLYGNVLNPKLWNKALTPLEIQEDYYSTYIN